MIVTESDTMAMDCGRKQQQHFSFFLLAYHNLAWTKPPVITTNDGNYMNARVCSFVNLQLKSTAHESELNSDETL